LDLELHGRYFTLVTLRDRGMAGRGVRDRVVVVGRHRAADPDRADDAPVLDDRHGALAEVELVAAEREHALGEERAPREALLEIAADGLERRAGVGFGAGDLWRHPERAVHPVARDQVTGFVDDGDRDRESELGRLLRPALDALSRSRQREWH